MADIKKSYNSLQADLDEILNELQSGELDIDEAIKKYEQGMKIAADLEKYLKAAKNKVTKIKNL